MPTPTLELVEQLYEKYADDVRLVRKEQRALRDEDPAMKARLDDLESELTYLLLREHRPETVVEVGCLHGWSTTWMLRALRDNDAGTLYSYDIAENAAGHVPRELSAGRWRFVPGDVRERISRVPDEVDYLFLDAAHSGRFAKWYLANLLPRLRSGTPVSVHDVFHGKRPLPFTEGAVLLDWLRRTDRSYFTMSGAHAPAAAGRVLRLREELGLSEQVHTGTHNPMLYFTY